MRRRKGARWRRVLSVAVVTAVLGVVVLSITYRWFDRTAYEAAVAAGFDGAMGNGIKHAYAAGQSYALLRNLGLGEETAEGLVVWLGVLNERVEAVVRRPRDSTAEVAKDMHNNYVGVIAARALERGELQAHGRLAAMVMLAERGVIARMPEDIRSGYVAVAAPTTQPQIARANAWFENHSPFIAQAVMKAMAAAP